MKFKHLYSLSSSFVIGMTALFGTLISCQSDPDQNIPKQPAKAVVYKYKPITLHIDTVYITDENFDHWLSRGAAGRFMPHNNSVHINYFKPQSTSAKIQNYCKNNNNNMRIVTRHEMEHARKAALTKQTSNFTNFTRGKIAAVNEVMAPASEIIEAMDYRAETSNRYPTHKRFIINADHEIDSIMRAKNFSYPVNFNNAEIANIVLKYSLQQFLGEVNRGIYITTIRNATTTLPAPYTPSSEAAAARWSIFCPDFNIWDPMWEFQTTRGPANIWQHATYDKKSKFINSIDSVVESAAGQNTFLFNFSKTR